MTGLNLETFLHLLRADWGAWLSLAAVAALLALMTWTSWGSRRALQKCLVLSVVLHLGLVLYGSTVPGLVSASAAAGPGDRAHKDGIRQIRVSPQLEKSQLGSLASKDGRQSRRPAAWDRPRDLLALNDPSLRPARPEREQSALERPREVTEPPPPQEQVTPEVNPPEPPRPEAVGKAAPLPAAPPPEAAPADPSEIAQVEVKKSESPQDANTPETLGNERLRPDRMANNETRPGTVSRARPEPAELPRVPALEPPVQTTAADQPPPPLDQPTPADSVAATAPVPEPAADRLNPDGVRRSDTVVALPGDPNPRKRLRPQARDRQSTATDRSEAEGPVAIVPGDPTSPGLALPDANLRQRTRPGRNQDGRRPPIAGTATRPSAGMGSLAMNHVVPAGPSGIAGAQGPAGNRPLADVPAVYRSRLDPNRSAIAQRAGASPASEQAVERALDWLARHQDSDGRWNGGSYPNPPSGLEDECRTSFTAHCPANDVCTGECEYCEADTALTGLALLSYLGAGYTHLEGKYAEPVRRGLRYLLLNQKADGDLRGPSRAVGMYCHAMASLALCEAYALTGDERLRDPVERAVDFLAKAQAADGLAWRYSPRESTGDTSILGWVVLVLRSARVVGIPSPPQAQAGALGWLGKVSSGQSGGLARYQPFKGVTETMTAEAWVCRQLLGIGGAGPASSEAAEFLLQYAPDRGKYNLYFWYYGTLAMYQHGGTAWTRWNAQVRDQLVRRQRQSGHATGSWDPDEDPYGSKGGRIYSTALATLTLEVYYRYLRFYDEQGPSQMLAPAPDRTSDPGLRRAGRRYR